MISKSVYNFEHRIRIPGTYDFGEYSLIIKEEHIKNIKYLPSSGKIWLKMDYNNNRWIDKIEKTNFNWLPTAELVLKSEVELAPSLFDVTTNKTEFDDLAYVFTILTGRLVLINEDRSEFLPTYTRGNYLDTNWVSPDFLKSLRSLKDKNIQPEIHNLYEATVEDYIISQFLLLSAIFESFCSKNLSLEDKKQLITTEDLNQIKENVRLYLISKAVEQDKYEDFITRISNKIQPSLTYKTEKFLRSMKFYPDDRSLNDWQKKEIKNRLNLFNKYRNVVVHNGNIVLLDKKTFQFSAGACFGVANVMYAMDRIIFLREYMGFTSKAVEEEGEEVKMFFRKGEFRKLNVFEEMYEEFLNRVEKLWVKDGLSIWE